jgi:hypothetical protein
MVTKTYILRNNFLYKNKAVFLLNKAFIKLFLKIRKKIILSYKNKFKVNQIWIWHFHFEHELKDLWLKIFEAFIFRQKIYKTKIWYVVTDIHLGVWKYKKFHFNKLIQLIKNWEPLYILWDLTERKIDLNKLNKYEKNFLEILLTWIKRWNVFYIRWNHDNCALKNYRREYMIVDDILLIHGDFLLKDPNKPNC